MLLSFLKCLLVFCLAFFTACGTGLYESTEDAQMRNRQPVSVPETPVSENPAPTVTQVSPSEGTILGGTHITITGTGFLTGATATVGGRTCTSVSLTSSTTLTCTTPTGAAGAADVIVTNTDSKSGTGSGLFTYLSNFWTTMTTTGAPVPRYAHKGVYTGSKVLIFGGWNGASYFNSGGQYDPVNDLWSSTTTTGAPSGRYYHTSEFTGSKMLTFGGTTNGSTNMNTGGVYDPVQNSWTTMQTTDAPSGRFHISSVFTGSHLLIFGGSDGTAFNNTGGEYSPTTNSWESLTTTNAPEIRYGGKALLIGGSMLVFGGFGSVGPYINTGGIYTPHNALNRSPLITSLSPTGGVPAGGGTLTINGENFTSGATVTVGGNSCGAVNYVSSSQLTCTIPAHAVGSADVVVTNSDAQTASAGDGFTYAN